MTQERRYEIGNRIAIKRRIKNMTQAQLAEKIDVAVNTISRIEAGTVDVKIDNIDKIADVLEVSLDYLIKGKEDCLNYNDSLLERITRLSKDSKDKLEGVISLFALL